MQRKQLAEVTPRSLVALLVVLAAGVVIGSETHALDSWQILGWALASALFGALVGLSEILSRYRDEPVRAATTGAGLSYLLLNAVISLFAFGILRQYAGGILPVIKDDPLMTAIVAGFGSMTIFRSKLFTFRTPDGTEYAIGPAIVLETVLKTIDQKIDRVRAIDRQKRVAASLRGLDDFDKASQYLLASLNSFQNLTKEKKDEIAAVIKDYAAPALPVQLKIMAMGFAFLNISGEKNFDQVIENLKDYLRLTAPGPPSGGPPPGGPPPGNTAPAPKP